MATGDIKTVVVRWEGPGWYAGRIFEGVFQCWFAGNTRDEAECESHRCQHGTPFWANSIEDAEA